MLHGIGSTIHDARGRRSEKSAKGRPEQRSEGAPVHRTSANQLKERPVGTLSCTSKEGPVGTLTDNSPTRRTDAQNDRLSSNVSPS